MELPTGTPTDPSDPKIARVNGGTLTNGDQNDITLSEPAGQTVGWTPHDSYPIIISFDDQNVLEIGLGVYKAQSFRIDPSEISPPPNETYLFAGEKANYDYFYTALLDHGDGIYTTLVGTDKVKKLDRRRPRIRVGNPITLR